jgi:hypothetical protein
MAVLLTPQAREAFPRLPQDAGTRLVDQLLQAAWIAAHHARLLPEMFRVEAAGHVAHCHLAPSGRLLWIDSLEPAPAVAWGRA